MYFWSAAAPINLEIISVFDKIRDKNATSNNFACACETQEWDFQVKKKGKTDRKNQEKQKWIRTDTKPRSRDKNATGNHCACACETQSEIFK